MCFRTYAQTSGQLTVVTHELSPLPLYCRQHPFGTIPNGWSIIIPGISPWSVHLQSVCQASRNISYLSLSVKAQVMAYRLH